MALMVRDGKLVITDGGLSQCEDDCECPTIVDCTGFCECFAPDCESNAAPTLDAAVTVAGVTDNSCGDCEDFNATWVVPGLTSLSTGDACEASWQLGDFDPETCDITDILVDIGFVPSDPSNVSNLVQVSFSFGANTDAIYSVTMEDAVDAIQSLCSTGSATLPLTGGTGAFCNWPATAFLELV